MCLLGFHLCASDAPGEAEADVAAFGGRFADEWIVGVEAAATGADGTERPGCSVLGAIIKKPTLLQVTRDYENLNCDNTLLAVLG